MLTLNLKTAAQILSKKLQDHATDYEIKIREGEEAFDWNQLFGNSRPVEIEIGCGRGMFIIKRALENPADKFSGH